jgi:hypothetical protein
MPRTLAVRTVRNVGTPVLAEGNDRVMTLSHKHSLSLLLFVIDNQNNFCSGLEVHGLNIRSRNQLYLPISNLSVFQKGAMFTGIRLFNRLPMNIQSLRNNRISFKNKLFLYLMNNNSFYAVDEFLEYTMND